MKHNFCGYNSFEVDITDYVEFDQENVLAVYVDGSSSFEGWWYQGAGIYRHVWLVKTELVSVDLYGVYVKPERTADGWNLTVENILRNDDYKEKSLTVVTDIINDGEVVLSMRGETVLPCQEKGVVVFNGGIDTPHLWSVEDPHQYLARTRIIMDGEEIDCYETKFGFRYFEFDVNTLLLFLSRTSVVMRFPSFHRKLRSIASLPITRVSPARRLKAVALAVCTMVRHTQKTNIIFFITLISILVEQVNSR